MIDGTRYYGPTNETVKSRAITVEALKIAEVRNTGGNPNLRKSPLLREFATRFLESVDGKMAAGHLDLDTKRYYHSRWKLLARTPLANMRIDRIGTDDAAVLSFPGSASSGNQAFRTLSRMLHVAVDWSELRAAPRIKLLRELSRTATITPGVEALLLNHAPQPLHDVLVIITDSGMRPEEVMRMRWEHILWDRDVILVPYGKTLKAKRHVPLSNRMQQLLRRRMSDDIEWVFPSARSASGHLATVNKAWGETRAAANRELTEQGKRALPADLVTYSARHTFATDMLAAGQSLGHLNEVMGHEDVKTTMKYLHPDTTKIALVVDNRNNSRVQPRVQIAS